MGAMKTKQKSANSKPTKTKRYEGFTAEERAAMRDRVQEQKTAKNAAEGENEVQAKLAEMPERDRVLGKAFHALVKASAPGLTARTYYGMPAYAKDGKVLCWFKPADKFKVRYATIGFSDVAKLDDGTMWPTEYALTKLADTEAAKLRALLKKAAS